MPKAVKLENVNQSVLEAAYATPMPPDGEPYMDLYRLFAERPPEWSFESLGRSADNVTPTGRAGIELPEWMNDTHIPEFLQCRIWAGKKVDYLVQTKYGCYNEVAQRTNISKTIFSRNKTRVRVFPFSVASLPGLADCLRTSCHALLFGNKQVTTLPRKLDECIKYLRILPEREREEAIRYARYSGDTYRRKVLVYQGDREDLFWQNYNDRLLLIKEESGAYYNQLLGENKTPYCLKNTFEIMFGIDGKIKQNISHTWNFVMFVVCAFGGRYNLDYFISSHPFDSTTISRNGYLLTNDEVALLNTVITVDRDTRREILEHVYGQALVEAFNSQNN